MKKWVILVLVVLGCAMLALQYLMNKKTPGAGPAATTAQLGPDGVPLPAGATGYSETPFVAPVGNFNDDPTRLDIPIIPSDYKGACEGGSLREMLATHNKFWGPLAKETPFSQNDTRQMYSFVGDYVSCVAIARDNALICDMLPPGPPSEAGPKDGATQVSPADRSRIKPSRNNLRYDCRKRVNPVLFLGYMAGKSKNPDSCNNILSGWKPSTLARISATDFCAAASKGLDAVNDYMQKIMSGKQKKVKKGDRGKQRFASSESSCGGNKECINGAKLYNAIKSGSVSQCPPPQPRSQQPGFQESGGAAPERPAKGKEQAPTVDVMCQAAVSKSAVSCEPIVKAMSSFYCDAVEQTKKKTGGFIGMAKWEIENAIAQKKAQAEADEKQKKEFQKMEADMNKKVKTLLSKEKETE